MSNRRLGTRVLVNSRFNNFIPGFVCWRFPHNRKLIAVVFALSNRGSGQTT
jgi:hypothetical protein